MLFVVPLHFKLRSIGNAIVLTLKRGIDTMFA